MPPKRRNINLRARKVNRSPTPERTPTGGGAKAKAKAEKKIPCNVIMQDEELIGQKIKEAQDQVQAKLQDKVIEDAIKKVRAANQQVFDEMAEQTAKEKGVKFVPPKQEESEKSYTDSSLVEKESSESAKTDETSDKTCQNILDRHNFQVNFVCTQNKEYEFETFQAYQKEPIKGSVANPKTAKVSRIDVSQFKQMKWHEGHTGIDWPDHSFIYFERSHKNKTPTLGAITKCCHSICFFRRNPTCSDQNGVEDHWCPADECWKTGNQVKFLTIYEVMHSKQSAECQDLGPGFYFQNLKAMLHRGHKPVTTRGRFWKGRIPMGPRAAVIRQDDMPLKFDGETQIFSAATKRQKTNELPSTIQMPSKIEPSVDAVQQIKDIDNAFDEKLDASHTSIFDDEARAQQKEEKPVSEVAMQDALEEVEDKLEEPLEEAPDKEEKPVKQQDQTMMIDNAAEFLKKLQEDNEKELADARAEKEAADEAQQATPLKDKSIDVSGLNTLPPRLSLPKSDDTMSVAPAITPPCATPKGDGTPNSLVPKSPGTPRHHYETLVGLRETIDMLKDQIKEKETAEKALKIEIVEGIAARTKLADQVAAKNDTIKEKDKKLEEKDKKIKNYKVALEIIAA